MKTFLSVCIFSFMLISCGEKKQEQKSEVQREEPSFNPANSDPKAVEIASKVIEAHGGLEAWQEKRFISWNFLGARNLVWDKYTGLVRIDYISEPTTYIINIQKDTGRVKLNGKVIKDVDSLTKLVEKGEQIWVNDSYWLVFPFKLKDPGVRLGYLGQDTTLAGEQAEVISLKFDSVGYTPQNKYHAYVNPESYLILQWDFFRNASDTTATFRQLWSDYKEFEGIKLAAGRGDRRLDNIHVKNELDSAVFTEF